MQTCVINREDIFLSFQVGLVKKEESYLEPDSNNTQQQHHYRLQLLAQAVEKIENECSKQNPTSTASTLEKQQPQHQSLIDSISMISTSQQQELLMKILAQQNVAALMAAAASAAQSQVQQQQKLEPISPPSTSSASSTAESPINFSSRRSTDDLNECSIPTSLSLLSTQSHQQQQLLSTILQNLQSTYNFPLLLTNKNGKPTRPFKAYPRESLMLPFGLGPSTLSEPTNILPDTTSRATANRERLVQTQERLKQRLQQQQLLNPTHFIPSYSTDSLHLPKKRHRMMENPIINNAKTSTKDQNNETNSTIRDDTYWERRRKNNEAAKRSRDARRAKEDEIALK